MQKMNGWWANSLCAGIGGFCGSVLRYWVSRSLHTVSATWPFGTLAANLAGCLIMGGIVEIGVEGGALSPAARVLLTTGFCGGFTTMSSLAYESTVMARTGQGWGAAVYAVGSLALSLAAVLAGQAIVRGLTRLGAG